MVALESSKLFSRLPADELRSLRAVAQDLSFASGQLIFKEGDPGDGVYVVKTGLVQISAVLENGERQVLSEVPPGDVFGEMAALDNQPRSASASAQGDTTVVFVPREALVNVLKRSPELSLTLVQEISGRLREFNRQYIQKLLQTERMALVGRFASSIVHDLKNPLAIISMTAQLVASGNAPDETRKTAHVRIGQQIDRITTLVNDILEFTRGGSTQLVLAPVDYSEFVRGLVEEFCGEVPRITLEYENAPPAVKIPLNPRRLNRVFYNLFGNAVDAMPKGGVIKLRFQLADHEVITEIEDAGKGIAPEVVDHLFEAFVTFGKPRGTGLGLSITRKIIEEHHGKISARNRPGGGAIFSFSLPRQIPAPRP
jgi:signal transduction histidine kinase